MSPEAAIYLVIWVACILGGAAAIDWALINRAGLPAQPTRIVIWVIAALCVILVLLRRTSLLG